MARRTMACSIEDYALIGDCETAALVGRDGSIDWLCWPRFDSAACFAALLGSSDDNGRWLLTAADPAARVSRRYRDRTLILETEFETADGVVTVVDFMPPRGESSDVVRLVCGKRGRLEMRTELVLRFDYGSLTPWVTRLADGSLRAVAGPDMTVLRTPVALHGVDFKTVGTFAVSAGQTIPFVLSYGKSHLPPPDRIDPEKALTETAAFWQEWVQAPERGAAVRVFPIAAATRGSKGEAINDFAALKAAGAVAVTDDGHPILKDSIMRETLAAAARVGLSVIQHAEDTRMTSGAAMNAGPVAFRLGLRGMPPEAESGMVERDIRLVAELRDLHPHLHVAHTSTAAAIAAVRQARRNGLRVTCEVAPHHFLLTDEHVGMYDTHAKMNPPLR